MPEQFMPGYDAARKWTPFAQWQPAAIARPDWSARVVAGLGQTLVSGRLDAARAALARDAAEIGLWQVCEAGKAFVRIARDRALMVTPEPLDVASGWRAEGFAASPGDDAWLVFEISGEGLRDLVAEAVTADLEAGSRSAAVPFAGAACLLYRAAPDAARLHVETGFGPYVWRWLETR